jgi:hypothetical protein
MSHIDLPSEIDHALGIEILSKYSLKRNIVKLNEEFDLFICNSGYEARTYGFLKSSKKHLKAKRAIVFIYHPKESNLYIKNLKNLAIVKEHLSSISDKIEIIEIDPINPWSFRQTMKELLKKHKINSNNKILVDITSFTRVFLYELIYGLYKSGSFFSFAYTEPQDYAKILPSGVNRIIITPSFMGKPRPNIKAFLLLFFGWETGRTRDIFEGYNSDDHVGVIGVSPIDAKHLEWQNESYKRNTGLIRQMKKVEKCSTLDLVSIINCIHTIYKKKQKEYLSKNERFYFVISGLGPKIQNVAACLFAIKHKDVQLAYGAPAYWGPSKITSPDEPIESQGIGDSFIYGPYSKNTIGKLMK